MKGALSFIVFIYYQQQKTENLFNQMLCVVICLCAIWDAFKLLKPQNYTFQYKQSGCRFFIFPCEHVKKKTPATGDKGLHKRDVEPFDWKTRIKLM